MYQLKLLWLVDDSCPATWDEWQLRLAEFGVQRVGGPAQAAAALKTSSVDCVLVTGSIPCWPPLEALQILQTAAPEVPVIFAGQDITAAQAVHLVRNGAFNCFGLRDHPGALQECLREACRQRKYNQKLKAGPRAPWAGWLIGESAPMEDVCNTIDLIGPRRCTVLITGETGTGKELAARALHGASPRAHLPLVAVNCSAIPENLVEAELFGHVKGAFTGASASRIGRFEQAHRSTLFLDEISEMPLDLQAKLLRVLQDREFSRLGSSETIRVDVRLVAATNRNILEQVHQGKFREDLYYRLNVVPLKMPPLRERRTDIPLLLDHFIEKICLAEGIPVKTLAPAARERLCQLPWPGNVRQLENAVEAAVALSGTRSTLSAVDFDLPRTMVPAGEKEAPSVFPLPQAVDFETAVGQFQMTLIEQALARARGNKTAAAELLRMKRTTLIMKLRGLRNSPAVLREAV